MHKATFLAVITTMLSYAPIAWSQGIAFVPGQYEISNSANPKIVHECYKEARLSAAVLQAKMTAKQDGKEVCKITEHGSTKDRLEVRLSCNFGNGITGHGAMTVTVSGQSFKADSTFENEQPVKEALS